MRTLLAYFLTFLFLANSIVAQNALKPDIWRGILKLNDSTELPFNFEVKNIDQKLSLEIINAEERIPVDEVSLEGDSLFIRMPVFDSEFRCKISKSNELAGVWINHARKDKNIIPFNAFIPNGIDYSKPTVQNEKLNLLIGRWRCVFSPDTKDSTVAVGLFKPNYVSTKTVGTFLTEMGDYRFLEGNVYEAATFTMSCFDGAHAFLFTGSFIDGDNIIGDFYSGANAHEKWIAQRNDDFQLRNPDSITHLRAGYTKLDFTFKNLEGQAISLSDPKFKNKVTIIQLMGSWCPNCMDETKYLSSFYDQYQSQGLEVVALAFERTDDIEKAKSNVQRLKTYFNVNYDFLITGKTGKEQASEALPMLNDVTAFPTTIFIDKKGVIRKIYTGFYGPATGSSNRKFVEQTNRFVEKLLSE
jgi:thiol-disulfide isomerase/thioredoxin